MAIFNLWAPVISDERVVCFDVTPGNIPKLERGSREWVTGALQCLGISSEPLDWSIIPWRCHFYSDYPENENWEDRWRVGWTVRVNVKSDISRGNFTFGKMTAFDQLDSSWNGHFDVQKHKGRAVILAYTDRDGSAQESGAANPTELKRYLPELILESVKQRPIVERWKEFRAVVAGDIFPAHAEKLDSVVSLLKGQDCIVDWQSLFAQVALR